MRAASRSVTGLRFARFVPFPQILSGHFALYEFGKSELNADTL